VRNVRNAVIIAVLALGVWALPGGGTAADFFGALLFVILTLGLGFFGGRMYLENRAGLESLGDRWRGQLYVAVGVIVLTVAAGPKLFDSGAGTLAWIMLLAGCAFALFGVVRHAREY